MIRRPLLLAPGEGWSTSKRLGLRDELPEWYAPYPFIFGGYRIGYCATDCARSVFALHNESVNIWSHGVGAFLRLARAFAP